MANPARPYTPETLAERVKAPEASRITGLSLRSVQDLAAKGVIPGAAKLGGRWTFDLRKLRGWIREQEAGTWQTSSSAARSGGAASRLPAANIDAAYTQLLGLRR